MKNVGAVILAAGSSTRLGKPKQLLKFRGETLIRRAVQAAQGAQCSPVAVVVGEHRTMIEAELKGSGVTIAENPAWPRGIGTSIRAAMHKLLEQETDLRAVLLLACDQPFVDPTVIESLLALREKTPKSIVASRYADTLGVPALFERAYFGELLALDDAEGAKSVIMSHPNDVAEFPFSKGAVDIDTAADYEKLLPRR